MPQFIRAFTMISLSLFAVSCKNESVPIESELDSLDNFASTQFKFNDCRQPGRAAFNPPSERIDADEYFMDIKEALENIPGGLRSAFFSAPINGRIALVDSVPSVCPAAAANDVDSDQSLSCIKSQSDSGPLTIYIRRDTKASDTKRNIHHSMMRAFGYVLSEAIAPNLPNSDAIVRVADELAVRMLQDVNDKQGQNGYSFEMFSAFLPAEVLQPGLDEKTRRQIFARLSSSSKRRFKEAVLAETFDSLYCSAISKEAMERDFPRVSGNYYASFDQGNGESLDDFLKVMKAEEALEQIIAGLADGLVGKAVENIPSGTGFALWGRWGAGNGPLRQSIRSWGSHRADGGGLFNAGRFASGGGLIFQRPWFNPFRW